MREQLADRTVDRNSGSLRTATAQEEARAKRVPQFDPLERVAAGGPGLPTAANHASALNRATGFRPSRAATSLLHLQRRYGNRYVQRVLALGKQGEDKGEVAPDVESAIERARGGGQTLDSGVRLQMESAFGTDFSGVRVHTDSEAHSLNEAVSAIAFTTGKDIFFRHGAYSPSSSGGKELLAHELTHVVQQGGSSTIRGKLVLGEPGDTYEQEADSVAGQVVGAMDVAGKCPRQFSGDPGFGSVQRQCACGGHAAGGECQECREKREGAVEQRIMRQAERRLRLQDDGGADGGSANGAATQGIHAPLGTADAGAQGNCKLNIYSDPGCPESSLISTCPINHCCPALANHFVMGRKDSTSSFKGSCSGQALETRANDPEAPCNWFYKDGGSDFLFATKLDCPIPIV